MHLISWECLHEQHIGGSAVRLEKRQQQQQVTWRRWDVDGNLQQHTDDDCDIAVGWFLPCQHGITYGGRWYRLIVLFSFLIDAVYSLVAYTTIYLSTNLRTCDACLHEYLLSSWSFLLVRCSLLNFRLLYCCSIVVNEWWTGGISTGLYTSEPLSKGHSLFFQFGEESGGKGGYAAILMGKTTLGTRNFLQSPHLCRVSQKCNYYFRFCLASAKTNSVASTKVVGKT